MKRSSVKRLVLLSAVVCMLLVWPFCLVRRDALQTIEHELYHTTEGMKTGSTMTQSFTAVCRVFCGLELVMDFNSELPQEGIFKIELLDGEDEVLYEGLFPYFLVEDYTFYRISLDDIKLKKGAGYKLRLTNQDVTENLPGIVYTTAEGVGEYEQLVFDGEELAGEAFVRYLWKEPLDWLSILGIWSGIGIAAALVWEGIEQFQNKKKDLEESENEMG